MSKLKSFLVSFATIASITLAVGAVAGAAMSCSHALILLVPAALIAIYPIAKLAKSIKTRLAYNK